MNIPTAWSLAIALAATAFSCGATGAEIQETAELILPSDPHFNVFELPNASGGGTVLLSFVSKDLRYCRAARFASDYTLVLACRETRGWKIEATSSLAPGASTNATAFGGGNMSQVAEAVETLRAGPDFLDELGIIEAASRGWRNPTPVDEQSLDARQILTRVAQVYQASKSYVDTGTVHTVYTTRAREWTGKTQFSTAYVAPHDFRFESTMDDFGTIEVRFIAWRDRSDVKAWSSSAPDLLQDIASIQEAIDAGAGISRDTSGMIPGLIFPGSKLGGDIVRLTSASRLEDAQIDGIDCFQVRGFRWPNTGQPTTVWIDKERFLIIRVFEESTIKNGSTRTTWRYQPSINVPVTADSLQFEIATSH